MAKLAKCFVHIGKEELVGVGGVSLDDKKFCSCKVDSSRQCMDLSLSPGSQNTLLEKGENVPTLMADSDHVSLVLPRSGLKRSVSPSAPPLRMLTLAAWPGSHCFALSPRAPKPGLRAGHL